MRHCLSCGKFNSYKKEHNCFPLNFDKESNNSFFQSNYDYWLVVTCNGITRSNHKDVKVVWECPCNKKKIRHHFNYFNPLQVFLVCLSCHKWFHSIIRKHNGMIIPTGIKAEKDMVDHFEFRKYFKIQRTLDAIE
jgi:hypothetical protein